MNKDIQNNLAKDFGIIVISVAVAVVFVKTGILGEILDLAKDFWFLESFIAGIFFTSVFTVAPAVAALGAIAQSSSSVLPVAIFGALGALCGDLIIFRFLRDGLDEDLMSLVQASKNRKLRSIFRLKFFRWLTFFLGALVVASPLPDELGLALMGFSRAKNSLFIPTSLIFNFLGILTIALIWT